MPQESPDYSPGVQEAPVVDQDGASPSNLGGEARRELQNTVEGAGRLTGSFEGERDAVLLSRASKKTLPAILGGALLAFLVACALGGYLLSAGQEGRPPSRIETPMPLTQPVSDSTARKGPPPGGPAPTNIPAKTQGPSTSQVPTPPEHPAEDQHQAVANTATDVEEAATEDSVEDQDEDARGPPQNKDSAQGEDEKIDETDPDNADNEGDDVSENGGELQEAVKSLDSALKRFEEAWSSSTGAVQGAFSKNYMPSGLALPALDYFRRQADLSKTDTQSGDVDGTKRENALMDVRLVNTLLEAATSRIELLRGIEKLCDDTGIGSTLLGRKAVPLPPPDILVKDPEKATFEDFTKMLKGFKFRVNEKALEAAGTVPVVLAQRLAASVRLETLQLDNDRKVHSCFQKFVLSLPFGAMHIVHANAMTFSTAPLFQSLDRAVVDREANTLDAEALGSWVVDWDIEGVLGRIALNEEDLEHIYGMRLGSYTASSPDDIFATALALI
ncbi:hypothetical protein, conserved [Eimeria brunetti]|uniref:Transmembrane protein n=1 Tax=Eimeria brunetti TaxID=51314 RepID=U6LT65_9EIME|nr:hypothetical protein, conserved [Eimeria brunetti]